MQALVQMFKIVWNLGTVYTEMPDPGAKISGNLPTIMKNFLLPLGSQKQLKRLLSAYQRDSPGENDVKGAIDAIFRLQDLYKISPQSFADGLGPRSHRLILEEIFELGFIALGKCSSLYFPFLSSAFNISHALS